MHTSQKILDQAAMAAKIKAWQADGLQIVFTNGCFDLVHLGHVDYLETASALGDKLVIGLNSDASVSRLKGASRPILDAHARSRMLAALAFVDGVVLFEEDTPLNLITQFLPDILIKGADYTVDQVVGGKEVLENGGRVELIRLVNGYSTSSIVQKIKSL
ncbi:UNVERIFIED_CONTAM: hypothetical protein GTU68_012528 [Idotea baltica]|nr:hypothetical protein [Idotea baltica]